jgi:deazaflavin-dependent oxidoreductase (nitroreductase family)
MKTNHPAESHGPIPSYRRPPWIMLHVFDPLTVLAVGRLGLDDHNGTRVLEVKGRTSGVWRANPVRLLELDGRRYLVAMYGNAQWVRNLRARGGGRMRLGSQATDFRAVELDDAEKLPVLRAYFKRYWSLVAQMTTVTSPDAPDEEIARAPPLHPVFRLA